MAGAIGVDGVGGVAGVGGVGVACVSLVAGGVGLAVSGATFAAVSFGSGDLAGVVAAFVAMEYAAFPCLSSLLWCAWMSVGNSISNSL